jgi:ankyrin repeat protein
MDARDLRGTIALMIACKNDHKGIVQILLEAGADVDLKDSGALKALSFAALREKKDIICIMKSWGGK